MPEPEQARDAYSNDVAALAAAYGESGGDIGALRSGVSQLAGQRGITNWEVDSLTCASIGRGMRQAGMDAQEFSAFSSQLFGDDLTKLSALEAGYRDTDQ